MTLLVQPFVSSGHLIYRSSCGRRFEQYEIIIQTGIAMRSTLSTAIALIVTMIIAGPSLRAQQLPSPGTGRARVIARVITVVRGCSDTITSRNGGKTWIRESNAIPASLRESIQFPESQKPDTSALSNPSFASDLEHGNLSIPELQLLEMSCYISQRRTNLLAFGPCR